MQSWDSGENWAQYFRSEEQRQEAEQLEKPYPNWRLKDTKEYENWFPGCVDDDDCKVGLEGRAQYACGAYFYVSDDRMDSWSRGRVCVSEYLYLNAFGDYAKNNNYGHYDYDYVRAKFGWLETFESWGTSLLLESAMQEYLEYYSENKEEIQHQRKVDFLLQGNSNDPVDWQICTSDADCSSRHVCVWQNTYSRSGVDSSGVGCAEASVC